MFFGCQRIQVFPKYRIHFALGQQAAKMWKDLRDTYRRKIKSGSSGEPFDDKSANWKFFDRMSFLKNYIGGCKYVYS